MFRRERKKDVGSHLNRIDSFPAGYRARASGRINKIVSLYVRRALRALISGGSLFRRKR